MSANQCKLFHLHHDYTSTYLLNKCHSIIIRRVKLKLKAENHSSISQDVSINAENYVMKNIPVVLHYYNIYTIIIYTIIFSSKFFENLIPTTILYK